jgi:hypothetical protein
MGCSQELSATGLKYAGEDRAQLIASAGERRAASMTAMSRRTSKSMLPACRAIATEGPTPRQCLDHFAYSNLRLQS